MKMDWLRTSLIAGIAFVCFLLVIRWNDFQERHRQITPEVAVSESPAQIPSNRVPDLHTLPVFDNNDEPTAAAVPRLGDDINTDQWIRVYTDVLQVTIDANGGDIVKIGLPTHYAQLNTPDVPFVLLNKTPSHTYIARSGLVGRNGTDTTDYRPQFSSVSNEYRLQQGDAVLHVDLSYAQSDSVTIIKRFSFKPGDHLIDISYHVDNRSDAPWQARIYGQIERDSYNPTPSSMFGMQPFLGAATTTDDKNYKKVSFGDISSEPSEHQKLGGWIAMVQHYFLSAWVPTQDEINHFSMFRQRNPELYYLQFAGQPLVVPPGQQGVKSVGFYAGPKHIRTLETISPYLDLTVDYSFLWWIAKPLFYALDMIHSVVGNWGVAIILLTMLVKLIFFYPSAASYRSMAKLRKVQPKVLALKERYGEDRQKFSAEMMKLYREEKVNPLGGCLPILIQMPVFLALYWVLMESVELRHAPFALWINDLSVRDPYFILPIIMGASMWVMQKLNPTPPDPMQARIMQMMPIFFTFLFLFFPAGLVLYWVVNNTLSIAQQYVITRQVEKQG